MNNQFSQRVSDIITYSKEEANRLRNRYIGPEHLLLGMLRDGGGKAIEILLKLDIDLKRVKSRLEGFLKDAEDDTLLPDAEVPLSPMTAKILKMCMLEARLLKSATADTEHVLLAILKDGDNLAATVLEEHRVDYQAVFEQLSMKSTNPNAGMGFTEDDEEDETKIELANDDFTSMAAIILEGLGGKDNVTSVDNCITRLRLEIKDYTAVDEKKIKSAGISGVIRPSKTSVQVIIGPKVQFVADEFKKLM